jgi:LmbE family N-acetylglucosaminyl deacetylase
MTNLRFAPARANVLAVAPHPDDDVIGCGGTLHQLARSGASITVLYVTDGAASHPGSRRCPPQTLATLREREARAALRELGIATPPIFFRLPDGNLAGIDRRKRDNVVARIASVLKRLRIDLVFSPWRRDPHEDHAASALLLEDALVELETPPQAIDYAVWAQVRGDALPGGRSIDFALGRVDIEAKRRALLRHRSQTSGLIDDAPGGFRIDAALLQRWLGPVERFFPQKANECRAS